MCRQPAAILSRRGSHYLSTTLQKKPHHILRPDSHYMHRHGAVKNRSHVHNSEQAKGKERHSIELRLEYTCTCYCSNALRNEGVRGWWSLPLRLFLTSFNCNVFNTHLPTHYARFALQITQCLSNLSIRAKFTKPMTIILMGKSNPNVCENSHGPQT